MRKQEQLAWGVVTMLVVAAIMLGFAWYQVVLGAHKDKAFMQRTGQIHAR